MCKRSKGIRAVCSTAALHMPKAEEVHGEGRGEVCVVHIVGSREAEQVATVSNRAGATDTTDREGIR